MNYRHGDVFLKQVDSVPCDAVKVTNRPLALGEVTGHSHRMTGDKYEMFEDKGRTYIKVVSPTPLIHEEHHEHVILPGIYEQVQEREYSYEDAEPRPVID